jgi:hypothetical protein
MHKPQSHISRRAFVLGGLAATVAGPSFGATSRREDLIDFPLIDNHSHLIPKSLTRRYGSDPEDIIKAMDAAGIKRMVLVGFGDEIPELPKRYPGRFVAAYIRYNFRWRQDRRFRRIIPPERMIVDGSTPQEVDAISAEFEDALSTGLYNALGEVTTIANPIHKGRQQAPFPGSNVSPDSPLVLRLMELAAKFDLPINIHCEAAAADEMVQAVSKRRKARVIWAHTGSYLDPTRIASLLEEHPNLDFDLSSKNRLYQQRSGSFLSFGKLAQSWRQLFEQFPDRFYFGVDFLLPDHWRQASAIGEYAYSILEQLTPPTARKIGYANAVRSYRLDP